MLHQTKKITTFKRFTKLCVPITSAVLLVTIIVYLLLMNEEIVTVSKIRNLSRDCEGSLAAPLDQNVSNLKQEIEVSKNLTAKLKKEFFQYVSTLLINTSYAGVDNYTQYVMAKLNLKPLAGVKPLRPEYGPVLNDVTSYKYPIEIKPCQHLNDSRNLFIAIISAVGNFEKRSNIRQTWVQHLLAEFQSDNNSSVNLSGYGFIVGQTDDQTLSIKIEEESRKYGDILQVGIIDYYYNLTLKAVGLVNWLNNHCSEVDFILKVDDDVYVNVRNLGAITKSLNQSEQTLYGSSLWHPTERVGKWKISFEDYPWTAFPSYPSGAAVLLPGIAIEPLLAATQVVPFLPFDDTYLLGLCTEKAGIKLHGTGRLRATGGNIDPCRVYYFVGWDAHTWNIMNSSYWATENFYKNVTQCVIVDSKLGNVTVDPFDYLIKIN